MCIRDSGLPGDELIEQALTVVIADELTVRQTEELVRRLACLLYTSDAADERSSVDLGGRRIIKKKKIRSTVSSPTT